MSDATSVPGRGAGSHAHVFGRGVLYSLGGAVLGGLANYLTRRVLAHGVSSEEYGFFCSAMALAALLVVCAGGGLGRTVAVLVAKYAARGGRDPIRRIYGHVFLLRVAAAVALGLLLWLTAPLLLRSYFGYPAGGEVFLLVCLYMLVYLVYGGAVSGLAGMGDFLAVNLAATLQQVLMLIGVAYGVASGGLLAAAWALVLSHAAVGLVLVVYAQRRYGMTPFAGSLARTTATEVWGFTRWSMVFVPALFTMSLLDTLMLTALSGLHGVAVYNIAVPLAQIFMVLAVVPSVVTPVAAGLWGRRDTAGIAALCSAVERVLLLLGWALVAFLLVSARAVVTLLFGARFEEAAWPLIVLGAGVPVVVMAQFLANVLSAVDEPRRVGRLIVIAVLVNVALNAALIRLGGPTGAASGTVLAHAFLSFMVWRRLFKLVPWPGINRANVRVSLVGGLVGVAALGLRGLDLPTWPALAGGLALGALFLVVCVRDVVEVGRGIWAAVR